MRVHLVDGTFELYRGHFSKRPSRVADLGRGPIDVKATLGVADSLVALLGDGAEAVTHLGVAFDNPIRSFRNDLFDGYKDDSGVPDELRAQFDLVEQAAAHLGIVVWRAVDHEADDVLATMAARLRGSVSQVRILSPDKDLGQCLEGEVVVQVDRIRERVITAADVLAQRGVTPRQIPELLALVGDPADGIPGLEGFGAKTAAKLLHAHGSLRAIPDDALAWGARVAKGDVLARRLREERPRAELYARLATLVEDVPVSTTLEELEWRGPTAAARAWFASLGAERVVERAEALAKRRGGL